MSRENPLLQRDNALSPDDGQALLPVGGPALLEDDPRGIFFQAGEELDNGNVQTVCDQDEIVEREVLIAAFNLIEIRTAYLDSPGKLSL